MLWHDIFYVTDLKSLNKDFLWHEKKNIIIYAPIIFLPNLIYFLRTKSKPLITYYNINNLLSFIFFNLQILSEISFQMQRIPGKFLKGQ
jgi:hypothetical protein